MLPDLGDTQIFLIGSVWSLFCAGLGWIAGYWSTNKLDQKRRKLHFIGFVGEWRMDVKRRPSKIGSDFHEKVIAFRGEADKLTADFWSSRKRREYISLVDQICSMTDNASEAAAAAGQKSGREKIVERLDSILNLVR